MEEQQQESDKKEVPGLKPAEPPPPPLPVCCQFVPALGLFRVLRSKGKTLSSSSSFTIASDNKNKLKSDELHNSKAHDNDNVGIRNGTQDSQANECVATGMEEDSNQLLVVKDALESATASNGNTNNSNTTDERTHGNNNRKSKGKQSNTKLPQNYEYIFIEDAVFLFERGVLECLNVDSSPFTSSQLYQLIPQMGMGLAMYFIFAHLRAQDFRLLRYSPDRLPLLRKQQQIANVKSKEFGKLKVAVRKTVQNAGIPIIPNTDLCLCWEAYKPNSNFAKTHPGIPDFYVAVTYYNRPKVTFSQIQNLIQNECHGIPLKLATVSDSGTVVLLGVSPDGVPSITADNNDNIDDDKY